MPDDIHLQPGGTVVVKITPNLEYRITHTGWTLAVACTQPIIVRPVGDKSIVIGCLGAEEDDG